jgi:hypothetical protein
MNSSRRMRKVDAQREGHRRRAPAALTDILDSDVDEVGGARELDRRDRTPPHRVLRRQGPPMSAPRNRGDSKQKSDSSQACWTVYWPDGEARCPHRRAPMIERKTSL